MKYCKYCGRQLQDDEECTNPACVAAREQKAAAQQAPAAGASDVQSAIKNASVGSFQQFMALLKNPGSASSYIRKNDFQMPVILLAVQAVLSGIFGAFLLSQVNRLLRLGSSASLSVFGGLLQTVLYSLIFSGVLFGLTFGALKLVHSNITWQQALALVSMRSIMLIPGILLSIVFLIISPTVSLSIFYIIAPLVGMVFFVTGMLTVSDISAAKRVYLAIAIVVVDLILVVALAQWFAPNYLPAEFRRQVGSIFEIINYLS